MHIIRRWFEHYFSDPQVVILAGLLLLGFVVVLAFGDMLAPVLAGVVIAYLLEGVVSKLESFHLHRTLAVALVLLTFLLFVLFLLFGVLPRLSAQISQLVQQLPDMISRGQAALSQLPERYPDFITAAQVKDITTSIRSELGALGQRVVSLSVASVVGLITLLVYLVLVPVLVFFFLKDKDSILAWLGGYVPRERELTARVWREVNRQIANYVRGKVWEILIVGSVTFVTFQILGLEYAELLATLVGLSVIIPYIGAAVVTVPVAVIAYFQFGWGSDFGWVIGAYAVIQALDGNMLVPLLFSEVVNLHPVAIIIAVLLFGGIWGFWGVFFAIPLATLVKAVLQAWPRREHWGDTQLEVPLPSSGDE